MLLLQPVLSPERALQWQRSHSLWFMQFRSCHPVLPAWSWEHPASRGGWKRGSVRGKFRAIQIYKVHARLVPPLLMPQVPISPGFLVVWGEAVQLVITVRLGENQGLDPLCVQRCDLLLQALAPAGPAVPSAFVSHVTSAGKIEPYGKVTEGKCSEKIDFQVLPVWDRSPQPDLFLTESTGSKYHLFKRQI